MSAPLTARARAMSGVLAVLAVLAAMLAWPHPADAAGGGESAVTVRGPGEFAGLSVAISKTQNLINETIDITWTGGRTTQPTSGRFAVHYLQIMQCWGDDPTGPRREQCQFGARPTDGRGGPQTASRQVNYGSTLVDPLETYQQAPGSFANVFVPFESVDGRTSPGAPNEYFDASTSNEIAYGRSRADGTGEESFEVHTALEAPGLGCAVRQPQGEGRGCWLVIVPRSDREVNGSQRTEASAFQLESSPLSATNWAQRIVVPLGFEPLGLACDFTKERRVLGQEAAVEAVSRWQPTLCGELDVTISYGQIPDDTARDRVLTATPGLSLVSDPVEAGLVSPTQPLVYAPLLVSGAQIGFLIEQVPSFSAPPDVVEREGSRIKDIKVTPRIAAKLLTQSYAAGTPPGNPATGANPYSLATDPEFLALNPVFADLNFVGLGDAIVPLGRSDAATLLWRWIHEDLEARAFLDGAPDPWGMVVNPAYLKLALPLNDFPKGDQHCQVFTDNRQPLCLLDWRPYASDHHEGARSASRGDSLTRADWDQLGNPPSWRRSAPQPGGGRALLALSDSATGARFGLRAASLRNAAGAFVAPTSTGLAAAAGAMVDSAIPGVRRVDFARQPAEAYPLTQVTYAVTAPSALTPEEGRDYASFLRFAAGPGQTPGSKPGTLPVGYLPLPQQLADQASAAAQVVEASAGVPVVPPPAPVNPSSADEPFGPFTPNDGASFLDLADTGAVDDQAPLVDSATAGAQTEFTPKSLGVASVQSSPTPGDPSGPARYGLLAAAALGGLAALAGPVLLGLSRR